MWDWQTYAQIAGVGGFGLGIYNLLHGLREPALKRQSELRDKLRDVLLRLRPVCESTLNSIKYGNTITKDAPPIVSEADDILETIRSAGILVPSSSQVLLIQSRVSSLPFRWSDLDYAESIAEKNQRAVAASENRLREDLEEVITRIDRCLKQLNHVDNGSYLTFFRYRSKWKWVRPRE